MFPDYVVIIGDEDGGVLMECRHNSHEDFVDIAYMNYDNSLSLNDLITLGLGHLELHP